MEVIEMVNKVEDVEAVNPVSRKEYLTYIREFLTITLIFFAIVFLLLLLLGYKVSYSSDIATKYADYDKSVTPRLFDDYEMKPQNEAFFSDVTLEDQKRPCRCHRPGLDTKSKYDEATDDLQQLGGETEEGTTTETEEGTTIETEEGTTTETPTEEVTMLPRWGHFLDSLFRGDRNKSQNRAD
jgi:hypothetical protein